MKGKFSFIAAFLLSTSLTTEGALRGDNFINRKLQLAAPGSTAASLPGGTGTNTATVGSYATSTLLQPSLFKEDTVSSAYSISAEQDTEKDNSNELEFVNTNNNDNDYIGANDELSLYRSSTIVNKKSSNVLNDNKPTPSALVSQAKKGNFRRHLQLAPPGSVGIALPGGTGTGTATTGSYATSTLLTPFASDDNVESQFRDISNGDELVKVNDKINNVDTGVNDKEVETEDEDIEIEEVTEGNIPLEQGNDDN